MGEAPAAQAAGRQPQGPMLLAGVGPAGAALAYAAAEALELRGGRSVSVLLVDGSPSAGDAAEATSRVAYDLLCGEGGAPRMSYATFSAGLFSARGVEELVERCGLAPAGTDAGEWSATVAAEAGRAAEVVRLRDARWPGGRLPELRATALLLYPIDQQGARLARETQQAVRGPLRMIGQGWSHGEALRDAGRREDLAVAVAEAVRALISEWR